MTDMDYATYEAIALELRQASAELDRVFAERGIKDGDIPVIAKSDEEAMSAIRRMQAVMARQRAWLDANVE